MNLVDVFLLLIILLSALAGWRRGFIAGALDLLVWIGSLLIGFFYYGYTATLLERFVPSLGAWTRPLAFIGTILLARLLLGIATTLLVRQLPTDVQRHSANRLLGVVPGLVQGFITATIVAALLLSFPITERITAAARDSRTANFLAGQVAWINEALEPIFADALTRRVANKLAHPEGDKPVSLPFKVPVAKPRPDLEMRMLEWVNAERAKAGLKPLVADAELVPVARRHSQDMFARGYFAHISPEGATPSDRLRTGRVRFLTAGENLALGQTLLICHKGLMNSPGHRANILSKAYGRIGIGILDGGTYGLMVTQNFRN